jgi:MoaA/NifB/PqqE/SkfB family radical SAM enzyme
MIRVQPTKQASAAPFMSSLSIPPFPQRITIELTSSCNLTCTMCPRHFISEKESVMDGALFEKIIHEMMGNPIDAVVPFFRGEPLMHPEFLDMMGKLKEKTSAKLQLATNALLLTPALSAALVDLDIDFISFSLDAFHKETYEKIRVGGDFHLAVYNVKTFL